MKMTEKDRINIKNFRLAIELRKIQEELRHAEYTEEFPKEEIEALSIEGLEKEIDKILLK